MESLYVTMLRAEEHISTVIETSEANEKVY
jgi:hypothetical protein